MQLSPNLSISAHLELVEGLFVKKEAPTMTHLTAISPNFPVSQLQPMAPIPTLSPPSPNPTPICMTGNDRI